jgi:hypothetical protein
VTEAEAEQLDVESAALRGWYQVDDGELGVVCYASSPAGAVSCVQPFPTVEPWPTPEPRYYR